MFSALDALVRTDKRFLKTMSGKWRSTDERPCSGQTTHATSVAVGSPYESRLIVAALGYSIRTCDSDLPTALRVDQQTDHGLAVPLAKPIQPRATHSSLRFCQFYSYSGVLIQRDTDYCNAPQIRVRATLTPNLTP